MTDLRWKVAAGLALDDEGFHPTVLTLWRNKLRDSDRPRSGSSTRSARSWPRPACWQGKTRRALDSTLLDDAVATQDTVTQLVSMIRRVRAAIPAAAAVEVTAHDYDGGAASRRARGTTPSARNELVTALVNDALAILDASMVSISTTTRPSWSALLALVAGQDVEPDPDGPMARGGSPGQVAKDRVISTVDPESRHMHKSRSNYRDGYKAHIAVEPDTGIITGCDLTPANAGDGPAGVALLEATNPAGSRCWATPPTDPARSVADLDARRPHRGDQAVAAGSQPSTR